MTFRLTEDRIAIIPDEESDTTESGLVLPADIHKEGMRYGTVAVVGGGYRSGTTGELTPMDFKAGDRVFWSRGSYGSEVTLEGVEYLFLSGREIVGVVE